MNNELAICRLAKAFAWLEPCSYADSKLNAEVVIVKEKGLGYSVERASDADPRLAMLKIDSCVILLHDGQNVWVNLQGLQDLFTSQFYRKTAFERIGRRRKSKKSTFQFLQELINRCTAYTDWTVELLAQDFRYRPASMHVDRNLPGVGIVLNKALRQGTYVALKPLSDEVMAQSQFYRGAASFYTTSYYDDTVIPQLHTANRVAGAPNTSKCPWGPPSKWSPK